jgi:pectate lyase
MKKILMTLLSAMALMPAVAGNNVTPWGWATCSDESGTAYTLSGGNYSDAKIVTLEALGGGQTDDKQIKQAIATSDIIILDGAKGDFTIGEVMKVAAKNKTIIGINNARLCTQFYLTPEDLKYLKQQNLEGKSSTNQISGTLPDGTYKESVDERAFYTMKAMMELQYQKTGVYSMPNKSGIFLLDTGSENIIIRNLSLIGPGAVDIDGSDLITNQGSHVWIDHCTLVDSQDGALDSKRCDWSTYTYNHFYYTSRSYSHAYTCGCGWADGQMTLHLTFASNLWGEGCMRRLPQTGDCYVHLVNNYHNCPGNSAGMTINDNCKALVENNFAAKGVNAPLTGSGTGRNVTARDNSFNAASSGSEVTVPYQYTKIAAADVPANLTGDEGAGATLSNDAQYILSTIPTATREASTETTYVMVKDDPHIGGSISEIGGLNVTFDPSVTDWRSGGTGGDAQEVDGVELSGYYTQSNSNNGAPILLETAQAGTLTIFIGGGVATNKSVNMTEGENGLAATVLSTGAVIESGTKPAAEVKAWDAFVYTLEANKTYKFFIGGTKWRLAALRYVPSGDTAIRTASTTTADGKTYNLQGQEVKQPARGLYIQNGRKVLVK